MTKTLPYFAAAALAVLLSAGALLDGPDTDAAVAADLQDAIAQAEADAEQARLEAVLRNYANLGAK